MKLSFFSLTEGTFASPRPVSDNRASSGQKALTPRQRRAIMAA
jgi:hypothetical protein